MKPKRVQSADPDEALAAAVAKLRDALAFANQFYVSRRDPDSGPNRGRRLAALLAVNAAFEFIESFNELRELHLTAPLADLAAALADLERGITSPMFKRSPKSGYRDSFSREMTKGASAAVMSILMDKGGLGREEAAKRVADKLRREDVALGGRRQLNWGTVAAWRDQVREQLKAKRTQDNAAVMTYTRAMHTFAVTQEWFVAVEAWPSKPDMLEPRQRELFCEGVIDALTFMLRHGAD
jgi:hypothetical protein